MTEAKSDKEKEYQQQIYDLEKQVKRLQQSVKKEKYGLVWMDVPEAFEDDVENKLPILKEVKEKAIVNNDGKPTHILIEGDNYHALTCLNYSHKEKVNLIYIDPPYNTGSDGFTYRDKRILEKYPDGTDVPKDHPLRHSYWLSFMSKRLELAYYLLKDDGVMFISINEEEFSQLKLLCDKIFQESNYLTTFTIKVRHADRILKGDKDFHETTEYLLMYRKSSQFKTIKRVQDNTSIKQYVYEVIELIENPEIVKMGNKEVAVFKPNEYQISKGEPDDNKLKKINIRGSIKEGNSSGRFFMAYIDGLQDNFGYLYKVPDMGSDIIPYRYFLAPASTKKLNGDYFQGIPVNREDTKLVPYPNYFDFEEAFNNVGYEGGITFRNGKKPIDFIKHILKIGTWHKDAIILDFFAGSGATGHAVMEQNFIDNGKRQFILITNNESNIAEEVTYPRMLNAIKGYKQTKNQKEVLFELPLSISALKDNQAILEAIDKYNSDEFKVRYDEIKEEVRNDKFKISGIIKKENNVSGLGNSLKYYKTDFVGENNIIGATDEDKIALAHHAGELLAIAENTLYEISKNGYYQFFENKEQYTAVYFREELLKFEEFIEKVKELGKPTTVYVFSWGENEFNDIFTDIKDVSVKTIPLPILEIYKNIYNLS